DCGPQAATLPGIKKVLKKAVAFFKPDLKTFIRGAVTGQSYLTHCKATSPAPPHMWFMILNVER
ncbi:MAG: hypothetical protein K8S13_18730, partial [Desulfobacula sp.]|uniref:hypothetical protein n=1 Tax=Desulfobacula sp. TaxID=2593537 RepID=UPI0025BEF780